MLTATLGTGLLGNMLAEKGVIRTDEGMIRANEGAVREWQDF